MDLVKCPNLSKVLLFQGSPLEGGATVHPMEVQ